jgi:2-polyprenyl-3-methyl-5-hydroxy-6-metoxy-1,4-benzoquinol methylase
MSPLANSNLTVDQLERAERFFPLHALVCADCLLVQLAEFESPEHIFSDYLYFSSYSQSWVDHAHRYVDEIVPRFGLGAEHQVVELASNDGYLLRWFADHGVPVLGIEPAANVAEVAVAAGIPTQVAFFGVDTARRLLDEGFAADLIIGNNVLAHVPALNDFVGGLKILLKPGGHVTMEFPHLLELIEHNQFDTIYHEHFSYFSFLTVSQVFANHGLRLFDVEQLPTHGGSLRIFACHADAPDQDTPRVVALRAREREAGLDELATYAGFAEQVKATKRALLRFLVDAQEAGKVIAAYGAPAKGNTLLNYCGIGTDFIELTVDRSPYKQGTYLPGTHIPVGPPEALAELKPDYVLILPWNLRDEIVSEMAQVRDWGGQFVVPIPHAHVVG